MMNFLTASTREIDDPKVAVEEILSQLEIEKKLLTNSLGIINCFSEFIDTGVVKALCDALPFDCIGATSSLCATGNEIDQIMLIITVLTSDKVEFKTTKAQINSQMGVNITEAINGIFESSSQKPSLIFCNFPLNTSIGGDILVSKLDEITGGIPLFGTIAVDHNPNYTTAQTILNGIAYLDELVMGAVVGEIKMTFEIASINKEKVRKQKGIITSSNNNILMGVNNKTALQYLEEIGLTRNDLLGNLGVIPFLIDHQNGAKPVTRGMYSLTPEGYAVCGGSMPQGASLSVGSLEPSDILSTTEYTLKKLLDDFEGLIISYSCIGRFYILTPNITDEAEKIKNIMNASPNYSFSNSGGEICPLLDTNGNLKNYFHNFTNVFCKLSLI